MNQQHIGITGASGLLGKELMKHLLAKGYSITVFQRNKNLPAASTSIQYAYWNYQTQEIEFEKLQPITAFIHLAGAGIADKKWTTERKIEIAESRIEGTKFITQQLILHSPLCKTFIGGAAIGIYGPDKMPIIPQTENNQAVETFLAQVCENWENASLPLSSNMRRIIVRTGIVYAPKGGAFPKLTKLISLGVNVRLGNGQQNISWIHISDWCRIVMHLLEHEHLSGTYNAVAPQIASMNQLLDNIKKHKKIWCTLTAPKKILHLVLGELSNELLQSQSISSKKIQETNFQFLFPEISSALTNLLPTT